MYQLVIIGVFVVILTMAIVYFWPKTCLIQRSGIETFTDVPTVDSCPTGTYSYVTRGGNTQCCSVSPNGSSCEGKVVCTMSGEGNAQMPKCSDLMGSTAFQAKNQPISVEGSSGEFCLTSDGGQIVLQKCKKGYPASQRFTYTPQKQILHQGTGKCLEMADWGVAIFSGFNKCNTQKEQQFLYNYKSKTLQSMAYPNIDLSMLIDKKTKDGGIVHIRTEQEVRELLLKESKKSTRKINIEQEMKNVKNFINAINQEYITETGKFDILPEKQTDISSAAKKFGIKL
jgi:hypothetical protein